MLFTAHTFTRWSLLDEPTMRSASHSNKQSWSLTLAANPVIRVSLNILIDTVTFTSGARVKSALLWFRHDDDDDDDDDDDAKTRLDHQDSFNREKNWSHLKFFDAKTSHLFCNFNDTGP